MTERSIETRSVVVERDIPFPPEKIWRALTQPQLIEDWLMRNDFQPVVGHRFDLRADWGSVGCQVMVVEPNRTLSYTWEAYGLESIVTWTLTPHGHGHGHSPAHGAVGLPAGSGAGLPGRWAWVVSVPVQAGADLGTGRMTSADGTGRL